MEKRILIIVIVFLVLAIIYITQKQNFDVYTSGAGQRFFSEFTSTNQDIAPVSAPINHYSSSTAPIRTSETELFKNLRTSNIALNI